MKAKINLTAALLTIIATLPLQQASAKRLREIDERLLQGEDMGWRESLARAGYAFRFWWLSEQMANTLRPGIGFPGPTAATGPSTWNGGSGNWSDGTMWGPAGAPNNSGADVSVDGANTGVASAVNVDGNFTIGRLTIDTGDSVTINDARSLSLVTGAFMGSGTILNNGTLTLNSGGNNTELRFDSSNVAFNGTGTITMGGSAANRIFGVGGTLTIGAGQTIQGGGSLGVNFGAYINNGTILANNATGALTVDPASTGGFTNNGLMRANGGTLVLTGNGGGTFVNTGTIEAQANSEVQLVNGASISGGTLSTTGNGTIRGISANLADLINNGTFTINDGNTTSLSGTITNNGNIALNSGGNNTELRFDGSSVALNGTGTVTMGGSAANRIFGSGGTLTIGANQTIQGGGSLGINQGAFINNGTILANNNTLTVDPASTGGFTNNGVMRANGGTLVLTGNGNGVFANANGLIEALANSQVQFVNGASISGGTLSTAGNGTIFGISASLADLTNNGSFVLNDANTTFLSGTITNNGNIALNSNGNNTDLRFDSGTVALNGTGTVTMNGSGANRLFGNGGTLTIGANQTIQGGGQLGVNQGTFVNNGTILANNGTLTVDPDSAGGFTNNKLMRASGGGVLLLTGNGAGAFSNGALGVIEALAGSQVQLTNGASISGGTLSTTGDGIVRLNGGQIGSISSLTNAGNFVVADNAFLTVSGAIMNTGNFKLDSNGNGTDILISGDTAFSGSGSVTLAGSFNARVRAAAAGAKLTIGSGQTFAGRGQIGFNDLIVLNQGLIDANVTSQALQIDAINMTDGFRNQGTMQASNGGVLVLTGNGNGAVNNTGGTIQAIGAGSEVQLTNGASIAGGILTTSTGGVIRENGGQNASISDLTNAGTFIVNDNSFLHVSGTITNSGSFKLDSNGSGTDILVDADTAFAGTGTVTLSGSFNARVRAGSGGVRLTIGSGQIFAGQGQIGFNDLRVTNLGLIDANVASQALQIDAVNAADGFLNQATMQATNGGVLVFTGNGNGAIINTGGTIQAIGAGSEVQLTNSASITGGILTTSNGGVIRENSGQTAFISDLTNGGTFIVNDNSFLHASGTITNNGSIKLDSNGSGTDILIDGDTTFTGTGKVTLAGSNNARIRSGSGAPRLTNAAGHAFEGFGQIGFNDLAITNAGLINANVNGQTLRLDAPNVTNGFLNDITGTLRSSNGGTAFLTANGNGSFTNDGIFETLNGSSLFMESGAVLTNNVSGVLTLGSYRSIATGNGATLTIRGANITQLADNTEVILSGAGSVFQVGTTALESTLGMVDGALRILDNRDYSNVNALADSGIVELGGGIFNAPSLTIGMDGELFGFGSVTPRPTNSGLIRSHGGTLSFSEGIQGGSGTVQSDANSTLSVSSGASNSSADFLANNGNLALGAHNFTVGLDYTNANFGVGNSFDPRANVSGAGFIVALGDVAQTLTGNVTGGATANPVLAFGNVHVGDMTTLSYQVNNNGTMGPSLRGALQTLVNGGNITDGRLGGSGVTAANFGPIGLGANSNFNVTFNANGAGALSGQSVHLINNFDNIIDQNLSITGAAFRFANPTPHMPEPVAFGNFHVGDAVSNILLSVTNNVPNDGFSESLNAMIGSPTGGVFTNGGSFTGLLPGMTNSSSLSVGISTATAGSQNGTATIAFQSNGNGSSGLGITDLAPQIVNVTGAVYRYADPSMHMPEPVAFGVVHVGDVVTSKSLSITNNAANDGFSESLNGSIGGGTNGVTANGSFAGLAPGSTNNSSLVVGINTATAGTRNGTATIGLVSNGTGSSGLGLTTLSSQTVNVSGQVNFYADPVLVFQAGSAALIMKSATSFTLDFGVVQQNSGTYLGDFAVMNALHDAIFQDTLGGSWDISLVNSFQLSGFTSFVGIVSGGTADPSVAFDSNMALGTYTNTILLHPTSSNASGSSDLGTIQLTLHAEVEAVPEPSTWLLLASGICFLIVHCVRRRTITR
jgi:hypothetical protein